MFTLVFMEGKGSPILGFERWARCLSPLLGYQPLGRWPGLSAEPKVTFTVRLLLISLRQLGVHG